MTYAGTNLVGVKYYSLGEERGGGILRAELELKYDGGNNLTSVTKVF